MDRGRGGRPVVWRRRVGEAFAGIGLVTLLAAPGAAASIDTEGNIRLGIRAYTAARIGTEDTDLLLEHGVRVPRPDNPDARTDRVTRRALTFPVSEAGALRQHRTFVEIDWNHDLDDLIHRGFGPFSLLSDLPFEVERVSYRITYRGEYEGIYDYGPDEYRTAEQYRDPDLVPPNTLVPGQPVPVDYAAARRRLRDISVIRNRLFQAYVQAKIDKLFLRLGRQVLVWGETDAFRLLDNINPLDSSFGGFLVPLDERRVPLDMAVARYQIGRVRPLGIRDVSVEAYAAFDDKVGFQPGSPQGSAWALPNLGAPSAVTTQVQENPARSFSDMRGGGRLRFNAPIPGIHSADFSIAHYYTYLDTPAVQFFTRNDDFFFPVPIPAGKAGAGASALIVQSAPRVQITGATSTFAIPPEWVRFAGITAEPIVRAEVAYFRGEPRFRQSDIDPFAFALPLFDSSTGSLTPCPGGTITADGYCRGRRRTGNSWNAVLGVDLQQWIRFLNPNASFFITTQVFYRHLQNAAKRRKIATPSSGIAKPCSDPSVPAGVPCYADPIPQPMDGEVLPVPEFYVSPDYYNLPVAAAQPHYVHTSADQILQTLLISTNYYSGRINPSLGLFYDWQGALVVQPQVTFLQDPLRCTVSYSHLSAGRLRGGSGISLLRDRDNVLFQIEYVL